MIKHDAGRSTFGATGSSSMLRRLSRRQSGPVDSGFSKILNNSSNDARYQGVIKVHYGLHRLLGKQGRLIRKVRYGGQSFLDVEIDGVRHTIHAWMADESHCRSLTVGDDPVGFLETFFTISGLLDQEL